jgi:hypothetical protein
MLTLTLAARVAGGADYCTGQGVETGPQVRLARAWQTVFEDRFAQGLGQWQVHNYRNALEIGVVEDGAGVDRRHRLRITREAKETDTAFELTSRAVKVTAGGQYRLVLRARHDVDLTQAAGHSRLYWKQIRWLDAAGREASTTEIDLGRADDTWHDDTVQAQAPAQAASAVVRIGFDSPNLSAGAHLEFAHATLEVLRTPAVYVPQGELVSRPLWLGPGDRLPVLTWQAETPAGTSVHVQVRSAAGNDQGPGGWTAFSSLDRSGAALPALHRGHGWFQYRVVLATKAETRTPVLREVRLTAAERSVADRAWASPDRTPPALASYSPRRTADTRGPLLFTIADNPGGVGVDLRSVEVVLDGRPITRQLQRTGGGQFRYDLPEPLAPRRGMAPLDAWLVQNYNGRLTVGPAEPPAPDLPPSLAVGRKTAQVDTSFTLASPPFAVRAGAVYQVSYWARHPMALRHAGYSGQHHANGVAWFDAQGKELEPFVPFNHGEANARWHQDRVTVTAPAGARTAVMSLGWDAPDLFGGAEAAFADPQFRGPVPDVPTGPNLHRVEVRAADLAGNVLQRDWWILVAPPPREGIVTMRDDGVVLVDRRPLFPIGLYAVWKREHNQNDFERCFAELRAAGFNTAHTYNTARTPELQEFYAAAQRHGLKVIIAARGGSNCRDPRVAVGDVAAEAAVPAVLAWYLADDTASHISADELRRVHEALRDIDPYHVTVQADGVHGGQAGGKSRYTDYVDSTDAFLPELYPIHSTKQAEVADIIRDMRTIAADCQRAGRKAPVWAIIQDFEGWGWERFPTDAELRAMTWLAIIHGATGMTYYTYGGHGKNHGATHDPQLWANLKRLAGQMASLHEVLTERDPPQRQRVTITAGPPTDALGYPAISTRLKLHGGHGYLLTANSSRATVRARIEWPQTPAQAEVLWEGRKVPVQGGAIADEFAPYAVHLYRW